MRKIKKITALLLVSALCLSGCGGTKNGGGETGTVAGGGNESAQSAQSSPAAEGDRETKDTITFANVADITSLDPQVGKQLSACVVITQIFDTLLKFDADHNLVPGVAESYEELSDKDIKFNIRKGVKFHNGEELTAEDVKYSLDRTINSSYVANYVDYINNVEIVDEYTVIVHTKEPYSGRLTALTTPPTSIVPKAVCEADEDAMKNHPIGCGPYKFVEWKQGEYCKLEAFDDYYQGAPKTKYVVMKVVPEAAQRTIMLETGEIDMAYGIAANDVSKIENNPDLVIQKILSTKSIEFVMNTKSDGPMGNKLVRQAIEYAVDKDLIVDKVLYGIGQPGSMVVTPGLFGYDETLPANKYDMAKAKELLTEAGYPDGFDMKIWVDNDQTKIEVCQVIQSSLAELGVNAEIEIMEYGTLLSQTADESVNFDAVIKFYNTVNGDGGFAIYNNFYYPSASNGSRINDEQVKELVMKGRTTLDEDIRMSAYKELYALLEDIMPEFSIYYEESCVGMSNKIEGFEMSQEGYNQFKNAVIYK